MIMPPSLFHYSLEGDDQRKDEKVGKCYRDGFLGYGDDEVRVSCVGREGRGEPVWLVKFVWIRTCVAARLPNHLDQQINMQAKKNRQ